ncbi:hypothetical protein KY284_021070 [Solanum tuberosum]|nr:hypothetical protein KY284_021070 [Solanum tuberosum]
MLPLLLARRLVDGTATQGDLMCNMVWYKLLLGDARMEGYMEVKKLFFSSEDFAPGLDRGFLSMKRMGGYVRKEEIMVDHGGYCWKL